MAKEREQSASTELKSISRGAFGPADKPIVQHWISNFLSFIFVCVCFGGALRAHAEGDCSGGFRRQATRRDFILGRSWEIFSLCGHPEMPLMAIAGADIQSRGSLPRTLTLDAGITRLSRPVESVNSGGNADQAGITAGSNVRLWSRGEMVRIDLAAVALDPGSQGKHIQVKLLSDGQVLFGVVRGFNSVELETYGNGFRKDHQ